MSRLLERPRSGRDLFKPCIEALPDDLQDRSIPYGRRMRHICSAAYDITVGQGYANWTRSNLQAKSLLCRTVNQG
jgi:hypothetical protein